MNWIYTAKRNAMLSTEITYQILKLIKKKKSVISWEQNDSQWKPNHSFLGWKRIHSEKQSYNFFSSVLTLILFKYVATLTWWHFNFATAKITVLWCSFVLKSSLYVWLESLDSHSNWHHVTNCVTCYPDHCNRVCSQSGLWVLYMHTYVFSEATQGYAAGQWSKANHRELRPNSNALIWP